MRKRSGIHKRGYFLILLFLSFFCSSGDEVKAQLRVLFLGNSYTSVNNLPQLVHDVAWSAGDLLVFDSNAPGGYQLTDHSLDPGSQTKIMAGGWDYVVIQGQSQEPVTYQSQFYSGGLDLYNLVQQYNPCAVLMPYMTWGRKNGDQSACGNFPVMCTYLGMDNALKSKYLYLAAALNGEVSPVSVVWRYLRQNYPNLNLYQADESHPSAEGSYAAACCFYASLFKKDPTLITFNFGLNAGDASIIKNAVKTQVFDSLHLWDLKKHPVSAFSSQIGPGINEMLFFTANSGVQQNYSWNFGDGATSTTRNPSHSYLNNGTYTVTLTTTNCDLQGSYISTSDTVIQFCSHTPTVYTSHPWLCEVDTFWTQTADSYQWYSYGTPLPETNQYLTNYSQYNSLGFSVLSTLNGCSELSRANTQNLEWSGYYFDAMGDPCAGDTVAFAVLHTNSFLSGSEKILWYKNDVLLPPMSNEDTLFIASSGKYECKVINPNSHCPLDTTSYSITYNCGDLVGMEERARELSWTVFPNPASESITLKFISATVKEEIRIYNATGRLTKVMEASGTTTLSIADLPNGLYFIQLKNNTEHPLKFIKQ